jgi:CRP-like cAMP-binding protein
MIDPASQLFEDPGHILGFTYVTELKQGSSFGEKGLDDGTPRTATILCSADCEFACLMKTDYDQLLKEVNKEKMEKINDFFYSLVFKNSISRALINSIGGDFSKNILKLTRGNYVFAQGSFDQNIYVIRNGMILIEYMVETEDRFLGIPIGTKRIIKTIHGVYKVLEGEILGEESLFEDLPKQVSAKVVSNDAELMWITKQSLRSYVVHSSALEDFFKILLKTKRTLTSSIIDSLCSSPARQPSAELPDLNLTSSSLSPQIDVAGPTVVSAEAKRTLKSPVYYLPRTQKYKESKASNFDEIQQMHFNPRAEFMRKEYPERGGKFPLLKDCEQVLLSTVGDSEHLSAVSGNKKGLMPIEIDESVFVKNQKFTQDIMNYRRNLVKQRGYGKVTKKEGGVSRRVENSQSIDERSRAVSSRDHMNSMSFDERKASPLSGTTQIQIYHNKSALSCQDFIPSEKSSVLPKKVYLSFEEHSGTRNNFRRATERDSLLATNYCRSIFPQALRISPFKRHSKVIRCLEPSDESTLDLHGQSSTSHRFPKIAECLRSKTLNKTINFIHSKKVGCGSHSKFDLLMVVQSSGQPTENSEAPSVDFDEVVSKHRPNLSKLKTSSILLVAPERSSYKP